MDKETGNPATAMQVPAILKTAFHDITTGGGRGGGGGGMAFSPEMRVFRFTEGKPGADAYLNLMEKYGPGRDLYAMMDGHLKSASRETAFLQQFGPNYRSNFRALLNDATEQAKAGTAKTFPILSTPTGVEKTFKLLTGQLNQVQNETLAGIMAGSRSWLRTVQLPSAVLSAVPGDSSTTILASGYNRISAGKVIAGAFELAAGSATKEADATRLGLIAYASADSMLGQGRYADQWLKGQALTKLSNTTMRMIGLQPWTHGMQLSATLEMLGGLGDEVGHTFDELGAGTKGFLTRYGMSAADWEKLRAAPLYEAHGAKFFDPTGVTDQALSDRLMNGIISERNFFIMEPNAQAHAIITPMTPRGTLGGEALRSFGMYKSFAITMVLTHMMRAATQRDLTSKIGYSLAMAATTTMLGALAIGAKDIFNGKDPRAMNTPGFWASAAVQGGGLGILGDLLYQGVTRSDTSLAGTVGGPLAAAVDDGAKLIFPQVNKFFAGKEATVGGAFARDLRTYLMPKPWYAKLAIDRLFFDEIQMLIDPHYRSSFQRQAQTAKDYGTQFWWRPGNTTPDRPPNLGNVVR